MTIQCGIVMDPIESIHVNKDSTLAMMLEAQSRGWDLFYMQQHDIYFEKDQVYTSCYMISVKDDPNGWFELKDPQIKLLNQFDVILMRKDPPFNLEYIYTTYLLEIAKQQGTLIVNDPAALRDANEKAFTMWFPQCCPDTLISGDRQLLQNFFETHQDVVYKPLEGMGGNSVFRVQKREHNLNVIIEILTQNGSRTIMAQRYIPAIKKGDKRILLINGEPIPHAITRVPTKHDIRGNLAAGATAEPIELTERDHWICQQVGPILKKKGLLFVGIDVIGDYLTEINVTSPTCIREIDRFFSINISATLMDCIQEKLACKSSKSC